METGASKEQIIKVIILAGILVLVLVFKGPIRKGISSLRNRSKSVASVPPSRGKTTLPVLKPDDNLMNENLTDENLMEELAETSRQRAAISPDEGEEWPECIKRDIFAFPKAPAAPVSKAPASDSEPKRARRTGSQTNLRLEATVTGDKPMAVINNQPLTVGQSISGYKVKEIREGRVVLFRDEQVITLTMR